MFLPSLLTSSAWRVVTRPMARVGGVLVLGGALLAAMFGPSAPATGSQSYRLVLETESDPACVYGSAWNDGDVVLSHDASDGKVVTMTSRYDYVGCTWEATEVLTPEGAGYAYEYTEHLVSCEPGAQEEVACPRRGHVTVVPNP